MIDHYDLTQLVQPLEEWFLQNARILPWREEPKAYYIWISEIMLQQTRVEAVKPYFTRFISELPDVQALAECPKERLLKLWEGLGYYNRARNLQIAAQQIMEQYNGRIPSDYDTLLQLKGIGSYTAGAIASIAYGQAVPAVDGNVLRVLSRVSADNRDIALPAVKKNMEELLYALMNEKAAANAIKVHPGIFNQALMELGATVCVPNASPRCNECPWQHICEARKQGLTEELPVKSKAKGRKIVKKTVLVIKDGDLVAIHKRPESGLLAGLYELPNLEGEYNEDEVLRYLKEKGWDVVRIRPLMEAKHIFSHVEWHMKGYRITLSHDDFYHCDDRNNENKDEWIFVDVEDIQKKYAIPSAFSAYVGDMKKIMNTEKTE